MIGIVTRIEQNGMQPCIAALCEGGAVSRHGRIVEPLTDPVKASACLLCQLVKLLINHLSCANIL